MRKDRIILDFKRFSIPLKIERGRVVVLRMKGNPKFATPIISIEVLEAKTEELETRSFATVTGGKEATALMYQTEKEWDDMMSRIAFYVDQIADGDAAVILNAGFQLAKQPAPAVRPDFSVELGGKSGSAILHRQAMEGAKSYIWQACTGDKPVNENEWTIAQVTSKATVELTGLLTLTKYWFRVAVVTANGTSPFNTPIMQVVI